MADDDYRIGPPKQPELGSATVQLETERWLCEHGRLECAQHGQSLDLAHQDGVAALLKQCEEEQCGQRVIPDRNREAEPDGPGAEFPVRAP